VSRPGRALPPRKDSRYPLYRRLGGPQSRSGHRGYSGNQTLAVQPYSTRPGPSCPLKNSELKIASTMSVCVSIFYVARCHRMTCYTQWFIAVKSNTTFCLWSRFSCIHRSQVPWLAGRSCPGLARDVPSQRIIA
jgi:hypothetical protein